MGSLKMALTTTTSKLSKGMTCSHHTKVHESCQQSNIEINGLSLQKRGTCEPRVGLGGLIIKVTELTTLCVYRF